MTQTMESATTSISRAFLGSKPRAFTEVRWGFHTTGWQGDCDPLVGVIQHSTTVLCTQTDFSLTNPHIKKSWRALLSGSFGVPSALSLPGQNGRMCHNLFIALDLKYRQAKNSKVDNQREIQDAGNEFNGKKLSFSWKGNKERGESGVGVQGAEAAPTTDLAPAQIPPWSWASQEMFSQYVPDFSHISPQMFSYSI